MHNTAVIILAAGNASRMGEPKQALAYAGTTLLQHVVREAVKAVGEQVYVVIGAHEQIVTYMLATEKVHIVKNEKWEEGMGTSISIGISSLPQNIDHAIIAVADQPYVTAGLLQQLKAAATEKGIVASVYSETEGTPALFSQHYFTLLRSLTGQTGAKKIIQQHSEDVTHVAFPEGNIDIDTKDDYKALFTD